MLCASSSPVSASPGDHSADPPTACGVLRVACCVSCHAREEEKPKEDDKEKENGKRSGAVDAQPPAKRQRAEAEEPPAPKTGLAPC